MLGTLLIEFLQFYGCEMNYYTKAIDICKPDSFYLQTLQSQSIFPELPQEMLPPSMKLNIKDPLNQHNNVGRSTFKIVSIKQTIQIAYYTLFQAQSGPAEESCCLLKRYL